MVSSLCFLSSCTAAALGSMKKGRNCQWFVQRAFVQNMRSSILCFKTQTVHKCGYDPIGVSVWLKNNILPSCRCCSLASLMAQHDIKWLKDNLCELNRLGQNTRRNWRVKFIKGCYRDFYFSLCKVWHRFFSKRLKISIQERFLCLVGFLFFGGGVIVL